MRLSEIPQSGEFKVVRDGEFDVFGLLDSPTSLNILAYINDVKFIKFFGSNVSCVICPPEAVSNIPAHIGILTASNPRLVYYGLHNDLSDSPPLARTPIDNVIGSNTRIHKMSCIADKNVKIGNNVLIEEFVSIKENTIIGDNVIIRAGTVIGGPGYYFIRSDDKSILPVRQFGGVVIEDDVEIQHSCCIDRAHFPWDNTIIGEETKLDNLIHIAHAVKIGKRVYITSCVSIAGNVLIGDECYIGPNSTITNNIKAGDHSKISLGSVVIRDVKDNTTVTGNFAVEHSLFLRNLKESLKKR